MDLAFYPYRKIQMMHTKGQFTLEAKAELFFWRNSQWDFNLYELQVGLMYSLNMVTTRGRSSMSNGLEAKEGGSCIMPWRKEKKGGKCLDIQSIKYDIGPKAKNRPSKNDALRCLSVTRVRSCFLWITLSLKKNWPCPRCNVVGTNFKSSRRRYFISF